MTSLSALWLPTLVAAVLVFVASSIIHMGPFWHRSSYPRLKNEDDVLRALRPLSLQPGDYMFPRAPSMADMRKPEHVAKLEQGPIGIVTVFPNGADFGMGRQLATWFVFCLVVGLFSGYVAAATLAPGTPYLKVFQVVGATAFMGYSLALYELSIWYRRGWDLTLKGTLDGLIYACVTAGAFGWLWPA